MPEQTSTQPDGLTRLHQLMQELATEMGATQVEAYYVPGSKAPLVLSVIRRLDKRHGLNGCRHYSRRLTELDLDMGRREPHMLPLVVREARLRLYPEEAAR